MSGYKTMTYYLHFAENPIRFSQVVYEEIWIFIKYVTRTIPSKFWQNAESQGASIF